MGSLAGASCASLYSPQDPWPYHEPPINPCLVPWSVPPPSYDSPEKEFWPAGARFPSPFSPEGPWPYGDSPINPCLVPWSVPPPSYDSPEKEFWPAGARFPSSFSPEGPWPYGDSPINPCLVPWSVPPPSYDSPEKEFWPAGARFPSPFFREGPWPYGKPPINPSPVPCEGGLNEPCADADGNKPTETLYGKTVSDGCGESNGKLTTVESMGTRADAHNWNCKKKPSESKAARNTSKGKDTGGGGAAVEYHTCEELGGRGSCGNACCTCAEADHFARKCTLGADCGCAI